MLDGFPQHVFVLRVFMCPTNITLFCLFFVSLFPATTPRATTPHTYHHGLSRLCIHPDYHTRAITLHQYTYIGLSHPLLVIRTFVVFISPAFTPPLLLHHHRAPHATTYSTLLDVLTPLSDYRHETVEKIMGRRISGVSYMCWIDFHNRILGCGFLCAQLMSVYSVSIL